MRPIRLLEETTGPTVKAQINGFSFLVPASWWILVVDEETKQVDTVQITAASSSSYQAFLMHPSVHDYSVSPIILEDLDPKQSCVHVMIPKGSMTLHPVGPVTKTSSARKAQADLSYSCLLSPQDLGKNMHGMTAMEVVL